MENALNAIGNPSKEDLMETYAMVDRLRLRLKCRRAVKTTLELLQGDVWSDVIGGISLALIIIILCMSC